MNTLDRIFSSRSISFVWGKSVFLVFALLLLVGCASSLSGSSYSRSQARTEQQVKLAVVESVRVVEIESTHSGIGTAAGATAGGVAASSVGHGKGSQVAAVLGAVVGGVAGSAIENATTKTRGLEITVKFGDGQLVAITQEADEIFKSGEQVRILSGGGVTRVTH